jgi:hypothetical protein
MNATRYFSFRRPSIDRPPVRDEWPRQARRIRSDNGMIGAVGLPALALDGGCSCSAPLLSVAYPASGNEVVHRPTAPSRATKRAAEIRSRWSSTAFLTAAIHLRCFEQQRENFVPSEVVCARFSAWTSSTVR